MATNTQAPDLAEFFALSKPKNAPCQIGLILKGETEPKLSKEELTQLQAALDTDKGFITAGAIDGWLKARGHETNAIRISNHRRGTCHCA